MKTLIRLCVCLPLWWMAGAAGLMAQAPEKRGLDGLETKPLSALREASRSELGRRALSVNPEAWQHAESKDFIYHCRNGSTATAVSIEAEFYYRVIAADLQKENAPWQRKASIYVFESPQEWEEFQSVGGLDPWTGGLNSGHELFLLRDSSDRWKGRTLGHEIAHLAMHRFFPNPIPLWLGEGYAENVSRRAYAAFYRARGYAARPRLESAKGSGFLPLAELMSRTTYPADEEAVAVFYQQSDRLVGYLTGLGKEKFLAYFAALGAGASQESALRAAYSGEFSGISDMEEKFREFITKNPFNQPNE